MANKKKNTDKGSETIRLKTNTKIAITKVIRIVLSAAPKLFLIQKVLHSVKCRMLKLGFF